MATLKEWWEFFSDPDVKWTFGFMMVVCWVAAFVWLSVKVVALDSFPSDDDTPSAYVGP